MNTYKQKPEDPFFDAEEAEEGRGTRQQVRRQYYHRTGLKETAKITAFTLPLSSTTLLEEIRGENNFSKYVQHRESNPNRSVQAAFTHVLQQISVIFNPSEKKRHLFILEALSNT